MSASWVARRRRVVGVALWLSWAPAMAWAAARLAGLEPAGLLVIQLLAFTPYVAAGSVLVVLGALLARRWRLAGTAGVTAAVLLACVLPRGFAETGAAGAAGPGPRLRVLTANLRVGSGDPATIVGLVRTLRVDMLALQEVTTPGQRALDAAGLAALLPHRVSYLEPAVSGLFSRFPLRDDGLRVHGSGFGQARATVSVPGADPVAVESVHPCAPDGPGAAAWWAADLANQPSATVDGQVRLLVGDFNATLDHAPLRRLLATGYRDAGAARGRGFTPTWPNGRLRVPGVTIDHVLADRRVGITDYRVYPIPGSDHSAVYAELVLPPATARH